MDGEDKEGGGRRLVANCVFFLFFFVFLDGKENEGAFEVGSRDWIGLDWIGLDWIGLDWIGLD